MAEFSHSTKDSAKSEATKGSFFGGNEGPAFFQENLIQRCAACDAGEEKEKKIMRQDAPGASGTPTTGTAPAGSPPAAGNTPATGSAATPGIPNFTYHLDPKILDLLGKTLGLDPSLANLPSVTARLSSSGGSPLSQPGPYLTPPSLTPPFSAGTGAPAATGAGMGGGDATPSMPDLRLHDPSDQGAAASPYSLHTPNITSGQPDWFGLTSPYVSRGVGPMSPGDYDTTQSLWQQNYKLGQGLMPQWPSFLPFDKLLGDFPTFFANTTTGAAVDNALKGDYPTPVEQSNSQSNISQHTFNGPALHFKLEINQPNDPYEKEADAMADKVIQRQATSGPVGIQRKCAHCEAEEKKLQGKSSYSANDIQRKCAHCEEEEKRIQKKDAGGSPDVSPSIESALQSGKGNGNPLSDGLKAEMNDSFGVDFSGVSIHTDGQSTQMNKDLNAHAFTHGNDIYFNSGKFDPSSSSGKHLLAHELTHVVQQGAASPAVQTKPAPSQDDNPQAPAGVQLEPVSNSGAPVGGPGGGGASGGPADTGASSGPADTGTSGSPADTGASSGPGDSGISGAPLGKGTRAPSIIQRQPASIQRDDQPTDLDWYPITTSSIDTVADDIAKVDIDPKLKPAFPDFYMVVDKGAEVLYNHQKTKLASYQLTTDVSPALQHYWVGNLYASGGWFPVMKAADGKAKYLSFDKDKKDWEVFNETDIGKTITQLDQAMVPVNWISEDDEQKLTGLVPRKSTMGLAIINGTASGGGGGKGEEAKGDGAKTDGSTDGPKLSFDLPSWFAELKKQLDAKVAADKKANPNDASLPDSLLYYGSDRVQAQQGMGDAWTIEIKAMLGQDAKKAWQSVHQAEWEAATSKDDYIQKLEAQIKDKVTHLNDNLNKAAFDKKAGAEDKEETAKGGKFAWAVKLKDAVWKELTSLKAKDNTLTDIPDKLTLVTEGEGKDAQIRFKVWIQQASTDPSKKEQQEFMGAPLNMAIEENSMVSDWVPMVRKATEELRKNDQTKKDPKEVPFYKYKAGGTDTDVKPPYPATIYPLDLSSDLVTVASATNNFRMSLHVEQVVGSNLSNQVLANLEMSVYYYWSVYSLPKDLEDYKQSTEYKQEDLIKDANQYVLDDKALGDRLKYDNAGLDPEDDIKMDGLSVGDYLLVGHAQPMYTNDTKRGGSFAAYPFIIADPAELGRSKTDAETDELQSLKDQLEKIKDDPTKTKEADALRQRIADLEKRQGMDLVGATQSDLGDVGKVLQLAEQLRDFIVDDRKQHYSYSGSSQTDPFIVRLNALNPQLPGLYNMIRKQYDPARYDALSAVNQYIEALKSQQKSLSGIISRANRGKEAFRPGSPVYRAVVTMIDKKTGAANPIIMEVGESIKSVAGKKKYTLVDVTSPESINFSDTIYVGDAEDSIKDAIHSAFVDFGKYNRYCQGKIEYRVTGLLDDQSQPIIGEADSVVPLRRIIEGAVAVAGMIALAAGVVASGGLLAPAAAAAVGTFATVLGVSAAVVGAGLAVSNMMDRSQKGTLHWDVETGLDIVNILAAITVVGGVVFRSAALAGKVAMVAKVAKTLQAIPIQKMILVYDLVDMSANAVLMGMKVKNDVEAIKALDISEDQKEEMLLNIAADAIQQGAMMAIANSSRVKEIAEHFSAKVEAAPYHSLKEKGWVTEEGRISEQAPPFLKERTPENEAIHSAEIGENNRKEAAVLGMSSAKVEEGAHTVTVTKKGKIIRCSDFCQELRMKYADLLEQEKNNGDKAGFVKKMDKLEADAKRAADTGDQNLADIVKQKAADLDNAMANRKVDVSIAQTPFDTSTLPDAFKNQPNVTQQVKQMRQGGLATEDISAILESAAKHGVDNPQQFLNDLGMAMSQRKNATKVKVKNTDVLVDGLKSNNKTTFEDAKDLMTLSKVGNQKASNPKLGQYPGLVTVDGILNTFSIEELRMFTTKKFGNEFVTGIFHLTEKLPNVSKEEMISLITEAGSNVKPGEEGWQRLNNILEDNVQGNNTFTSARGAIEKYNAMGERAKAALGDKEHGFSKTVELLWGENTKVTEKGKYEVVTQSKPGTEAYGKELYQMTTAGKGSQERMESIVKGVTDGAGAIDPARWEVVHDAVLNANIPETAKSGILGELWTRANEESIRQKGFKPSREVWASQVNPPVDARIDLVYYDKNSNTLHVIECKARSGELTANQEKVYGHWDPAFNDPERNQVKFTDPNWQKLYTDKNVKVNYSRKDEKVLLTK